MTAPSTQTTHEIAAGNSAAALPDGEICEVLRRTLRACTSKQELYRTALRAMARHYDAPFAALHVDDASGTLEDYVSHDKTRTGPWKELCDGLLLGARYKDLAVAKLYEASGLDRRFVALAVPLAETVEGTVGAIVVVSRCDGKSAAEARLSELKALVSMVGTMASAIRSRSGEAPATSKAQDHEGVVKAAAHQSLHEFAFAIANNLKSKTGCEQVCLGLVRRRRVKMLCMSGLDNLYPRSPGVKLIVQAMEECLDADRILCYQNEGQWDGQGTSTGHRLHRRWHNAIGNASVASIPLQVEGRCVAVLSLRQAANKSFRREALEKISGLVTPLSPGLLLMEKAHRGVFGQCWDAAAGVSRSCLRPGAWGRKALATALVALVVWMIVGTKSYVISVPCEVVPAEKRHLAAPFEGTIAAAHVKPGEHVVAGQLLVELDTRDLVIQLDKLLAELAIAELELAHAAKEKDVTAAAQARSRIEVSRAELAVTEHRIARARICAPEDGVILAGDLFPRVGEVVPLGEPLLEVAPGNRWSVELHVPESVAVYLAVGQTGEFTTYALPDQTQPCRLEQIDPSTEVVNGKNVFTAEAGLLDQSPVWTRAGMQGMARIDAGKRPVWWVWLHRTIDSVRLQLWKL